MSSRYFLSLATCWVVVLSPVAGTAQTTATPEWTQVRPGAMLRVSTGGAAFYGRFGALAPDSLRLTGPCSTRPDINCASRTLFVELQKLQSAEVRRSQLGRGFALGAGIGLGLGAVIGLLVGEAGEVRAGTIFLSTTSSLGVVGALAGLTVGSAIHEWRPLPIPAYQ